MYEEIIKACKYLLHNLPEAQIYRDYLLNRLSQDSIDKFEFGYFPPGKDLQILSSLVDRKTLSDLNLFYSKEISDYKSHKKLDITFFEKHPIIMSYRDTYNNCVAMVGRSILSDKQRNIEKISKYKNTDFKKRNYLFGLNHAKTHILKQDFAYIVEGQFDVIKANEKGINNIVAIGNSSLTPYQFSVICRYTNNLHILLDNDSSGESGRAKIERSYGKYAKIKNVYIPAGYKDIDEYLCQNSAESLSDL